MKKTTKNKFYKFTPFLNILVLLVSFFTTCYCLTSTNDYQLEMFCAQLTNPRKYNKENYKPSLMKFKYKNNEDENYDYYKTLFYTYIYNDIVDREAIITDNSIALSSSDRDNAFGFEPYIVSQFIYTNVKTEDTRNDRYILNHGNFACYLPITTTSYNCDEFAYISDRTADKWISIIGERKLGINNLDGKQSKYSKLLIYLRNNNIKFTYTQNGTATFAISNVYYSDFGDAPRTYDIYGDFILSYALCRKTVRYGFDNHYELETHIDTYGNKNILNIVENHYGDSIDVSFYLPSDEGNNSNIFTYSEKLTKMYYEIRNNKHFQYEYFINVSIIIIYAFIMRIISKFTITNKKLTIFLPILLITILYGLLCTYLYIYSLFGYNYILFLLIFIYYHGKERKSEQYKIRIRNFCKNSNKKTIHYTIDI